MHRLLLACVLAAVVASPAAAQPAPWEPERLTAGWVFTPSAVFGGIYDSNPTLRQSDNLISGEMLALFSPRGELDFNGRRARFNAGYSGTLEAYQDLEELTRYDQRGRLNARYQMTPRLLFRTQNQLTLTPTTDQLDLDGLPFTRVGSQMLTNLGGFTFDVSPRLVVVADYMFQWVNFDRDLTGAEDFRFLQGGHAHNPSATVEYELSRRVKVGSLYMFRHTVVDGGEEVFDSHRAQGTVQVMLTANTTVRGRAGVDHILVTGITQTKTGPSFGAGITQRMRQASFDASYQREFMPSFGFGNLIASQVFRGGASVPFARGRAFVSGGVTYRRSDPVVQRDILVELDSLWTQATFGYGLVRWLRMESFVSWNHQTSSARGNTERTRVGVQFVTLKPMRIQ